MRLEIDQVPGTTPYSPALPLANNGESKTAELLEAGIRSAKAGDRSAARTALLECTELDPNNEAAWMWLASISEYPEELSAFLKNVLSINPANQKAAEWSKATSALMAKTFVERGAVAAEQGDSLRAEEQFNAALAEDPHCITALMWLASLQDSDIGRSLYFEKVLAIDPEHDEAGPALAAIRSARLDRSLAEAKAAAVAGRTAEAFGLLDAVISESPDCEEAWMLRSMFTENYAEKIRSFERVLEINPGNAAAAASLESLRMLESAIPQEEPQSDLEPVQPPTRDESYAAIEASKFVEDVPSEKHPTQDLELPDGVSEAFGSPEPGDDRSIAEDSPASFDQATELPFIDEAELEADEWGQSIVAEIVSPEEFSILPPSVPLEDPVGDFEIDPNATVIVNNMRQPEEASFELESALPAVAPPDEPSQAESIYENSSAELDAEVPPIPAPAEMPIAEEPESSSFDTVLEGHEIDPNAKHRRAEPAPSVPADPMACPFCKAVNEPLAPSCTSCFAGLTLSDLELLLENSHVDRSIVRHAVERMEIEKRVRPFTEYETTMLGIGHLNIGNLETGYSFLLEATKENPNNVVLASYVNSLHIRLEEIRSRRESADAKIKGKTILVIDDSPTIRKLISGKLEKSGHIVFCSSDGVEALERLQDLVPDLVLLDIAMPRMDGYQVCKMIRSNEATKDVPVVMISGKDGFFDKVRGRMAGTSGYITKPFGPETLMKIVDMYLQNTAIDDFPEDEIVEDE